MGSKYRKAFTMAELAIGVLLILIIGGPVVMTFRSGIELYTKTEANAEVTNGVRFTVDSFNRRISPMLDHTSEISVLLDPTIPDPVPQNDNYLFLLNDKVVHRDISGDHFLEGSEHISGLTFTVPSSAVVSPDNYLLEIALNGSYKTAKLDVEAKQPLYNIPVKDGDNIVSDNYVGNVIYFKTPGAHDMSISFDVYDNATKIKINNSLMPKGTVILASYDLNITRNGIEVPYTDESSLDWYISDTTGSQREIYIDQENYSTSIRDKYQFLLVDDDNKPITVNTFDTKGYDGTAGNLYIRTGTGTKTLWGPYGVIRARLRPAATTSRGKKLTAEPVWSPYVEIKNKTFWETWLDAIRDDSNTTEGFYNTNYEDSKFSVVEVTGDNLGIGITKANSIKAPEGSFTVARLDYKFFDNERLYSVWKERPDTSSFDVIPTLMTVTNYSILVNLDMNGVSIFGLTLSDTPDVINGVIPSGATNLAFNDIGYTAFLCAEENGGVTGVTGDIQGVFLHPQDGSSTANIHNNNVNFSLKGITNEYRSPNVIPFNGNSYNPKQIENSVFAGSNTEDWWNGNHRILYSVIEYYDKNQGKGKPRYIFRIRFLKSLKNFTVEELNVIKKEDPWFIGPDFFASEPMWFGDFVGDIIADNNKVEVRRYNSPAETTVQSASAITNTASDRFYGLKNSTHQTIFKKRLLDLDTDATDDTYNRVQAVDRDRYLGLKVYVKNGGTATIYTIDIVPGFTADEIRSILPTNGKLYTVDETTTRRPTESLWYNEMPSLINYNDLLFGTDGYSDGSGNNGSRYNSTAPGILGLQHVPGTCTCPLDNELFKWIK